MPFPDFEFFAEETNKIKNKILSTGFDGFQKFLNKQDVIRCFIPGGPAYGHYAACVNMVRRFIELGYSKTVEIFVDDLNNGAFQKVYELIPELQNKWVGKLQNATIKIRNSNNKIELKEVDFGFCGACDFIDQDMPEIGFLNKESTTPNNLYNLKVRYFLMIQPYKWKVKRYAKWGLAPGNLIFFKEKDKWKFLNLDTGSTYIISEKSNWEESNTSFFTPLHIQDLGFYSPTKDLDDNDWVTITSNSPDKDKLWNIYTLTKDANRYSIAPLYGFNYSASKELETAFRKPVRERLAFVMASFQTARRNNVNIKPPIIINFSPYDPGNDLENSFNKIIKLAQGEYTQAEKNYYKTNGLYPEYAVQRNKDFNPLEDGLFFKTCTFENKEWKEGLNWLNNGIKRVLFIQADRVPSLVFNYILKISGLPPIFEGNNTAIPAMMAGRPYFHVCDLTDLANQINRYPQGGLKSSKSSDKVLALTNSVQNTANQFQTDFSNWPLIRGPAPNKIVSDFINNTNEDVFNYFGAIKEFFSNPENDKLSISFSIFSNLIKYIS